MQWVPWGELNQGTKTVAEECGVAWENSSVRQALSTAAVTSDFETMAVALAQVSA